ncbi:MAG: acylphosphatase [Saprospiraceae bacterium]
MDQITVQIHITGKVQGVWFRASAKDVALSLGLKGKVWNNPDDSVGAIAQGDDEKVKAFIEWCKEGPKLANIKNVRVEAVNEHLEYHSFEITRHV